MKLPIACERGILMAGALVLLAETGIGGKRTGRARSGSIEGKQSFERFPGFRDLFDQYRSVYKIM